MSQESEDCNKEVEWLFEVMRPSVLSDWHLSMLGSHLLTESGKHEAIFLDDYLCRFGFQILKKDTLALLYILTHH